MVVKLLIIEEETTELQASIKDYCQSLNSEEYELIFAFSGEEALEIINNDRQREIDLIIADLKLPSAKVDGWQFIRTLAKNSIDIKIIVITAWGHLDDFSEQERKNIVYFIERNSEKDKLKSIKERIELALNLPDRFTTESKKVRFNTLRKIIKDLPSKQIIQLMKEELTFLNRKDLKQIEKDFPNWVKECVDEVDRRDKVREWLLEKERSNQFKLPTSITEIDYFTVGQNKVGNTIYYRIQWTKDGNFLYKQIPAFLSKEFIQIVLSTNS
jgi:CheY-like chemotaxis protein